MRPLPLSRFLSLLPASCYLLTALLLLACTAAPPARNAPGQARWISLSPSMTEILFSVGAGPEVVGVCSPSTTPPEAATLPAVASWDRLDVERVLALAPSACFTVEGMQPPQSLESLNRMRVEVVAYPMRSLDDLWTCMEDVGRRTGHTGRAREVVSALKARVALAGSGLTGSPRRALVVVGLDPLVAAGSGSFLSQVLRAAGYENALSGAGDAYPVLSMEAAVAADPEAVVFPEGEIPPKDCARFVEDLRRLTARPLQSISIPADLLVRPGPRTADAVERLAAARREKTGSREVKSAGVRKLRRGGDSYCVFRGQSPTERSAALCVRPPGAVQARHGWGTGNVVFGITDIGKPAQGGFHRSLCLAPRMLEATSPLDSRLCPTDAGRARGPSPTRLASRPSLSPLTHRLSPRLCPTDAGRARGPSPTRLASRPSVSSCDPPSQAVVVPARMPGGRGGPPLRVSRLVSRPSPPEASLDLA